MNTNNPSMTNTSPELPLTITGAPMATKGSVSIQEIPLNKIKLSRNSRLSVSTEELDGLMQSIKQVGLLQPIGVVKSGSGYEISYGNRRFMAVSKLGLSRIPAVVHSSKEAFQVDIQNLTENVQRRNISLAEVGRYIELLKAEGLGSKEVAVRLGVNKGYVESCIKAYQEVPAKYRDDLMALTGREKVIPGKIPLQTARSILTQCKSHRLQGAQIEKLFAAAKKGDGFSPENIPKYAAALKSGDDNFLKSVQRLRAIRLNILVEEGHWEELHEKYIQDGPFKSMAKLMNAVLRGEKSIKIKTV